MTFRDLFENALRAIAESPTDGNTSDYEERASYVLATFCTEIAGLDRLYRTAHGMTDAAAVSPTYVELSENVPFCAVFAAASESISALTPPWCAWPSLPCAFWPAAV